MKLTDQEQVILKAIGHGVAEVSRVIKAVGYPKATTKKILIGLSNKGVATLYRHDWPASLTPDQRKLMVKIGSDYYNAVSIRERNPVRKSKGKQALRRTGKALKGAAKSLLTAGAEILGSGAMALNPTITARLTKGVKAKVVQVKNKSKKKVTKRKRNLDHKDSTHQVKVHQHWRAGGLSQWQRAHHAGQHDLFAHGIKPAKNRNSARLSATQWANEMARLRDIKPRPLVKLYGKQGPTPEQEARWKDAMREWDRQYRHASKMQKIALEEDNAAFRARQAQNKTKKKRAKRNASRTVSTAKTAKRRSVVAGKTSRKATAKAKIRSVAKARKAPASRTTKGKRRNTQRIVNNAKIVNKHTQAMRRLRAVEKKIEQGRVSSISFPVLEKTAIEAGKYGMRWLHDRAEKEIQKRLRVGKRNPSAESIRKTFAGTVSGSRDLYFPKGTPAGKLAKLGKLVSITTKAGIIKPVHGTAWLCADTKGKLHIGSTSNTPLIDGPARSFGQVTKLEYEGSKPHLGYYGPIIWFHRVGEENKIRPTLRADGKGGLVFRGGDYRLTSRGIEN